MKTKILFFIIFISSFTFYGQNNFLFSNAKDYNVEIKNTNSNNKQVIDRIALANKIASQNVNFVYKIIIRQKIFKNSESNLKVLVRLGNIVSPSINYRNFQLSDDVLPKKITYTILLFKNNKQIWSFDAKSDLSQGAAVINIVNDSLINKNQQYSLRITKIRIDYNHNELVKFNSWTNMVDNYDNAVNKTDEFYNQIHSIPNDPNALSIMQNLSDVYDYDDISLKAINFVQNTKQRPFYNKLAMKNQDPQNLANNLDVLFQESSSLHASCTNVINRLDLIYFDRGEIDYRRKNYQDALYNYNKSIEVNPNYTQAHYMIAEIDYNLGNYNDAENILKNILLNIRGDNITVKQSANLANQLYNNYLAFAEKDIALNNFDKALDWLYRAQDFCNSLYEVACDDHLDVDFLAVYEGKMNFLLNNVDVSIKNFQMQNAENFLQQAINFRNAHIQFLQDDKPLYNSSMNIYQAYITLGDQARKDKKYDIAINDYVLAKTFCMENQFVDCPGDMDGLITNVKYDEYNNYVANAQTQYNYGKIDEAEIIMNQAEGFRAQNNLQKSSTYNSLFTKIKQKQYYNFINAGLAKMKTYDYQNALNDFNNAKKIEDNYTIRKNYKLKTYISSAAKNIVLQKIALAEDNVSQNNLDNARMLTQEAREIADQYNLMSNRQVSSALDKISSKIFSQECVNYKNEFNEFYDKGVAKINEKEYLEAEKYLQNAKNISSSYSKCYINSTKVDNKLKEIKDVVDYYKAYEQAMSNYNRRDYSSAINEFNKSTELFETKKLEIRFKIKSYTLKKFISERTNDFVLFGAGYFVSNDNYEDAIDMLNILKGRNSKSKETKIIQTDLGVKLAIRDHKNMASSNPKSNVLKYTFNDKWFKYLTKSYLKTWKKL